MKKQYIKSVLLCAWAFLLAGCGDDLMTGGRQYYCPGDGVFVCNEGNYMYGNASLSYYDPETRTVENQVFYNANNFPLGDVCQSMEIIDGRGYVVVNNSGKIYVIDPITFKYLGVISGLTSPRYVVKAGEDKLYVSDLYSPCVSIVDMETLEVTGTITLPVSSTGVMVAHDGYVYVCASASPCRVFKIDVSTHSVVSSVQVALSPNSMVMDVNNSLWVLCDGGYYGSPSGQEMAALLKINPVRMAVEKAYRFSSMDYSPYNLRVTGDGKNLYYVNTHVYKMSVESADIPSEPFVTADANQMFYGLGVNPENGDVYVADAINYVQKGRVYRYSSAGNLQDEFTVDIIPGAFCFK